MIQCNKQTAARVLDAALHRPSGVAVRFDTKGRAVRFRQLAYTIISRERKTSGNTPWDHIAIDIQPTSDGMFQVSFIPAEVLPVPLFDPDTGEPLE